MLTPLRGESIAPAHDVQSPVAAPGGWEQEFKSNQADMSNEPQMTCHSMMCGHTFEKRHVNCPECNTAGVSMLYKHRAINDYFWTLLEAGEVWCPSARSLNDPYEFDFRLLVSSIYGRPINQSDFAQAKDAMRNYGVISFVENSNSILMWAYYSDSHRGVCLGFDRNDTNELGKCESCVPVLYHPNNELPNVMPLQLTEPEAVTKIITTKSNEWSHELEWRMLTHESDRTIPYPGRLARVIFGINTEAKHRKRIRKMLGDTVDYYQASKSERYFTLGIDLVPAV